MNTAANPPTATEAHSAPKAAVLWATLLAVALLAPAAAVFAVKKHLTGWPLADFVAGLLIASFVFGAWAKYSSDRADRALSEFIDAAEAAGMDPDEIFDCVHSGQTRLSDIRVPG